MVWLLESSELIKGTHSQRKTVNSQGQYSFYPLTQQTRHLAPRGSFGVTDCCKKLGWEPFSSPSTSVQQQMDTPRSNLKGLHPAATEVQLISAISSFSAFAGNCKQSQQPPPTHVANSCQEVLFYGHQWMQTKVNRDSGSSNTPQQHHFEDRWSLKTNKIPATHSCSPIPGPWPRKDSSCNIFSWTRATFISWRQEISSRLWQWTCEKTFNSFPLKSLWDKCEDKCPTNTGKQGFSLISHGFQNPFFLPWTKR